MAHKKDRSGTNAGNEVFVISRTFNVPRELLFRVWTDPKTTRLEVEAEEPIKGVEMI